MSNVEPPPEIEADPVLGALPVCVASCS